MADFEVERKFPVAEPAALANRLSRMGIRLDEPVIQVDQYYAHPARDFALTDEALRLRQVGAQNFITYKGPKVDSTTKTRREIELPLVSGDESAAAFDQLLKALGFVPVAEVHKRRRTAVVPCRGQDVELAWDEVDRLGTFVELELRATTEQVPAARETLGALAGELKLTRDERRSYLEMLLSLPPNPAAPNSQ